MNKALIGNDLAQRLIEEFAKNRLVGHVINTNKDPLVGALASAEIPEPSAFDSPVPGVFSHSWDTSDIYQEFSVRRILRNSLARDNTPSGLQRDYDSILVALGIYSSDRFIRRLLADGHLVERMAESGEDFSLLGKFTSISI